MNKTLLFCPITRLIFRNPVIASDGQTYELFALKKCMETSHKSPLTNLPINKECYPAYIVKHFVEELLTMHPELKEEQYKEEFDEDIFYKFVAKKQYDEIDKYCKKYLPKLSSLFGKGRVALFPVREGPPWDFTIIRKPFVRKK